MKTNATRCDLCHAMVEVSGNISEKVVHATFLLNEKGRDITMTVLTCPRCGKESIVQVDDQFTKEVLSEAQELYLKRAKFFAMTKPIPMKLAYKIGKVESRLSCMRAELAKQLDGALYQIEGEIHQLDYRYHAR